LVFFQIGFVQHRLAAGALDPQAFRNRASIGRVGVLDFRGEQFFEPTHDGFSFCGELSFIAAGTPSWARGRWLRA
jgi:hypothetical protein